ncbi:tripartite tricarboxylate transporter substrate binding protein [Bordetella sp. LUAb4]|uniref:Bug family tripartite tricarboxylate transporter substrate binding protein n=1 Tax=Bordetella sp. LUAb4 TaxID=2843195 RepID=UPI001E5431C0
MQFGTQVVTTQTVALAMSAIPFLAMAQPTESTYPSREVSIVIGYPPGGGVDVLARVLAKHLGKELKQKVVIIYKPGAAGNIGAETVARRAKPDGYTLFMSARPNTIHKVMYANLKFDFAQDLRPIGLIGTSPNIIVTGEHTLIKDLDDLLYLATEYPGRLRCASSGVGTTGYLLCEMFQQETGTKIDHVPYKGSEQGYIDLVGGRVDILFTTLPAAAPHISAGAVRAVALMSQQADGHSVKVPTLGQQGYPMLDLDSWAGLMAPAETPDYAIDKLNSALNTLLESEEMRADMARLGYFPAQQPNRPLALQTLIAQETERWTAILKTRGIFSFH